MAAVLIRPQEVLLTKRDLMRIYSLTARSIERKVRTGELPSPVRFGRRCVRWRASDVAAHLDSMQYVKN